MLRQAAQPRQHIKAQCGQNRQNRRSNPFNMKDKSRMTAHGSQTGGKQPGVGGPGGQAVMRAAQTYMVPPVKAGTVSSCHSSSMACLRRITVHSPSSTRTSAASGRLL